MAKQNKPAIRFKGFTDAWEQRKLSEIAGKVTEKNTGLQYVETLTNSAEFGIISQRDFFDHDISKLGSLDGYYIVRNEDFVYNPRISTSAPVGPINRNKLGRTGVMSPLYTVFRPHDIDTTYLEHFFKCGYWYSFMNFNGDSGARSDRFSIKDDVFFQMPIPVPHIEEQRKIGLFLTQLDHLITLHQRKYDKLQVLKKAMLEKMFPKNGSSVPEIRFKGFTDAWEQRKLENYLAVSSDKNTSDIYNKADVLSVSGDYGIVNQIEFQGRSFAGASVSNYGVVQTGDVVYTKSPLNSNPYGIIKTNKGRPGIVSTLYAVYHPRENAFPNFIQVYFEQHARMNNYMHPLVNKGAKNDMKVSAENALKGFVCFPSYEEQETISAFFQQLDNLITLHQRELEKLQNIKKSMLEKMFV
ncbi:restriction endonuclease subunit S [Gemmiger sp.]